MDQPADACVVRLAVAVYRWLLWIFPPSFRREYGTLMIQAFRTACREAHRQRGTLGIVALWPAGMSDLVVNALAERVGQLQDFARRLSLSRRHPAVVGVGLGIVTIVGATLFLVSTVRTPAAPTDESAPAAHNPGSTGPYAAGVTRRALPSIAAADGQRRTIDSVIWYPAIITESQPPIDDQLGAVPDAEPARAAGPFPVVVFAHSRLQGPGLLGYLLPHLASHGFVVVATPSEESWLGRPYAMLVALDQALMLSSQGDPLLSALMDGRRLGAIGVGFGADTVLRAANLSNRFSASVAMAPTRPTGAARPTDVASRPLLLMGGVLDDQAPLRNQQLAWDRLPPTTPGHRFLVFDRAGHGAFGTRCPPAWAGCGPGDLPLDRSHAAIKQWTAAFLLAHVARDDRYAGFLDPSALPADPDVQILLKSALRVSENVPLGPLAVESASSPQH